MTGITYRTDDGLIKFFHYNQYVGYLDGSELRVFTGPSSSEKLGDVQRISQAVASIETWIKTNVKGEFKTLDYISVISFLASKLALYNPTDPSVQFAIDFIERHKK